MAKYDSIEKQNYLPLVYFNSTRPCSPTKTCGTIKMTRTVVGLIASSANTCKSGCNPENPKKLIKIISKSFPNPLK